MSNELMENIDLYRFDPSSISEVILDKLESAYQGDLDIVDAGNPFMFLIEATAVTAATSMAYTASITRKLYPTLANTQEDLYRHMSDEDYLGRFAIPSGCSFKLLFNKAELIAKAVLDDVTGLKKIIVPRNTQFLIAGYTFGIHYPIEIRILPVGSIQIVYDGTEVSPITVLDSNVVEVDELTLDGTDFLQLTIPTTQFSLRSEFFPVNESTGINESLTISDQFYFARAYHGNTTDGWTEMHTTHSEQVFDSNKPTVLLRVEDDLVYIHVPQIYHTNKLLGSHLRVDLYETKGDLSLIMNNYPPEEYKATWRDLDTSSDGKLSAPLETLTQIAIYADGTTTGGRSAIDFDELRVRVIDNSNAVPVPVTDEQLAVVLKDRGYNIIKRIDNITDRNYHATRLLPSPASGIITGTVGTLTENVELNIDKIRELDTVYSNGERTTISPNTLYGYNNGLVSIFTDSEREAIESMAVEKLISELNTETYMYTPFHHVLDTTDNVFVTRAYYLDAPEVISKRHIAENVNTLVETNSATIDIARTSNGYTVYVVLLAGNIVDHIELSQLNVQLAFTPAKEKRQAYLNGTYKGDVDGNPMFEFLINTNFDLDENDRIGITNFRIYESDLAEYFTDLETIFSIYYSLTDYPVLVSQRSSIDHRMGTGILPNDAVGTLEESCTIRIGSSLHGLKNDSRSLVSAEALERYTEDVKWTYESDVYATGENGHKVYSIVNGEVVFNKLHSLGDVRFDESGNEMIRYKAGDVKLDEHGRTTVISDRNLNREVTITMFDAKFRYTTDANLIAYRTNIPKLIIGYLEDDISVVNGLLLERTDLSFTPTRTLGTIDVTVDSGDIVKIPASQAFTVEYFLTQVGYEDLALRRAITLNTPKVISLILQNSTVSVNDLNRELLLAGGSEVISVNLSGLGGDKNLTTYTLLDRTSTSMVENRLELLADGTTQLTDDVTVSFILHTA